MARKGSLIAVLLFLFLTGACGSKTEAESKASEKDIPYQSITGVDPALLALDVYTSAGMESAPVVIFIHGGTWTGGDKGNVNRSEQLVDFFQRNGAVLVSANIRLQQSELSPDVTFREQAADVAAVIRWTRDHIQEYGGDPKRLALFGFSSGAHLVALVGTDESYLRAQGLDRSALQAVMCFDVDAYDIPRAIAEGKDYGYPIAAVNLPKYFTHDLETQKAASPMTYVREGETYPAFLIVWTGYASGTEKGPMELSKRQAELFVDTLQRVGATASQFGDLKLEHNQLIMQFGQRGFGATKAVQEFLNAFFWGN